MINITVKKRKGSYLDFLSKGHAGYAEEGQDIVCAAASILVINTINAIEEFTEDDASLISEDEMGMISYHLNHPSKDAQLLLVSHSTNLLTNNLLRPDQIYTVDFIDGKGSVLNRVSDSKPREAQNLEKMYLSGVFNGLPNIK